MGKKYLLFLFFILLLSLDSAAQINRYTQRTVSISASKILVEYSIADFSDVKSLFSNYKLFFHQCGMPSVPIINDFVFVPKHSNPNFSVKTSFKRKIIPISIPQSIPKTIDSELFVDSVCSLSYGELDEWLPCVTALKSEVFEFESFDLLYYQVYPFQYNPKKNELSVNTHVSIEIELLSTFSTTKQVNAVDFSILSHAANFQLQNNVFKSVVDSFPNYVIISHPNFSAAIKTLKLWKSQQGFSVSEYQSAAWTADSIRLLMKSLYASPTLRPQYLLLFGDTNTVPSMELMAPPPIPEAFSSDLYYTTMDSDTDWVSNFSHGRISVSNATEALNVVNKLIRFQKTPPTSASFYTTMVNCSFFQDDDLNGFDDRRFVQTSEEVRSYLQSNYAKNVLRIYEAPSSANPLFWNNDDYSNGNSIPLDLKKPTFEWNGTGSEIVSKINAGTFLLLHRDHGYSNASGWAHPQLATPQLSSLTNDSLLPLIFSINCYSGNFRVSESFAERLIRQNAGASGVFAPSYYSYSGNNDAFTLGLYDALFPSPGLVPTFSGTGGNHSPMIPIHPRFNRPGDMLRYATWYMNYTWEPNKYSSEIAHFQGDPAMPIFTEVPLNGSFAHKDSVDCVDSVFLVSGLNASGFLATLTVDNQVISRCFFQNDTAKLYFLPQYGNSAVLTITKEDYAPYIVPLYWYCSQPIYQPIAGFSVSDLVSCNQIITFADTSLNQPSDWFWNFGDGSFSTLQNPSHQYSTTGNYTATLIASNLHGSDTISMQNLIQVVVPTPLAPIDSLVCHLQNVVISNPTNDSLAWYDNSQVISWANSVTLFPDTLLYRATFVDMPEVEVGKIDTVGEGGYIYQNREHYLNFTLHTDILLKTVDIYALNAGVKTIKILNINNQIVASKSITLIAGKNTVLLNFFIPQGENYRFVAPTYTSWYANFSPNNFPFSVPNILDIDSSSLGNNYYFFYRWTIQKRCFSPKSEVSVKVVKIDTLLSRNGEAMICDNVPILIFADSTASVTWNTGAHNDSIYINQPGWYSAELEKYNCLFRTDTIHVVEQAPIIADFNALGGSPCCFQNSCQNSNRFIWDFGDGLFSTEVAPCHPYDTVGIYLVTLTAMNDCDTLSVSKSVLITSIADFNISNLGINIFPNPTYSNFTIQLLDNELPQIIHIYNMYGSIVKSISATKSVLFVDFQDISAGIYYVELVYSQQKYYSKLLKLKL